MIKEIYQQDLFGGETNIKEIAKVSNALNYKTMLNNMSSAEVEELDDSITDDILMYCTDYDIDMDTVDEDKTFEIVRNEWLDWYKKYGDWEDFQYKRFKIILKK